MSKSPEEKGLCHAASKGDGLGWPQEVDQHLGHRVAGIGYVHSGQVGEEEVHGGVQPGVQGDEPQDDPVAQQGEGVQQGEEPKQEHLHPWAQRESQQEELSDRSLVAPHLPGNKTRELAHHV